MGHCVICHPSGLEEMVRTGMISALSAGSDDCTGSSWSPAPLRFPAPDIRELLEMIRRYQPDALIYIQGIMHVSKEKSSSDSCRNNTVIAQRNGAISTLANGRDIFYIDINPYVCDDSGDLIPEMSGDGIHLKASAYEEWDRFLMENAVVISE